VRLAPPHNPLYLLFGVEPLSKGCVRLYTRKHTPEHRVLFFAQPAPPPAVGLPPPALRDPLCGVIEIVL
jgi:hypothetical protein